jgi:hypothetical protein
MKRPKPLPSIPVNDPWETVWATKEARAKEEEPPSVQVPRTSMDQILARNEEVSMLHNARVYRKR